MYAYVNATSKIKVLLEKIQEIGLPSKVTQTWLTAIGFKSTNDRALLSMLRQIKFVDASGQPTRYWEHYRAGDRRALAQALRDGYAGFFDTYPDAHRRSSAELENLVKSSNPRINLDTTRRAVSTFRALVTEADFGESVALPALAASSVVIAAKEAGSNGHTPVLDQPGTGTEFVGTPLTVNVNVQLTLPETTDGTVYEKLFAAMREHLLSGTKNAA